MPSSKPACGWSITIFPLSWPTPVRKMAIANDHIGDFEKGPFEVFEQMSKHL
jgi:hypothetical protein